MNIIANTVASKLFVAFVATAMLFTLVAPAKAQTSSELEAQIQALMAQIAALQGGSSTGSSSAACTFTRALTVGSQGADVTCLQNYLISKGFSIPAGATGYFGAQTQSAVAAWQSANGVMPAAGYFGPVSQAKYSALMASAPTPGGDDDDDDTSGLSGEASLDTVEVSDGEESDEVEEGSEDVQVAEIEVNFEDGDALITRLDIALVGTGAGNELDPWDVFEEVSLWVDGDEIDRKDTSDEDEFLDEDDGSLRFSGLDIMAEEDEDVTIVVAVSVANSVDGTGAGAANDWDVYAHAIRYVDADDVTTTDETTGDLDVDSTDPSAEFAIEVEGEGDDLDIESSDEDPDATTFGLDEDDNTEEAIFAFDLSAEDSDGDIELNELTLTATVTNPGTPADDLDDLVNDFRLEVDGQSFNAESYTGATTTTLVFDIDGDVTVGADEVITAVLFADFENMDNTNYEGSTIVAGITGAGVDAEGADDVDADGSAQSETHTLRVAGVDVTLTDSSAVIKENTDTTTTDDEGVFEIEFDVTAFGEDLYIDDNTHAGTAENNTGVNYTIEDSNGTAITATSTMVGTLSSDADEEDGYYVVEEGETETFTLRVEYDPASTGSYKLILYSVNFNDTSDPAETQQTLSPESSYDSGFLTI